jgi:hypothetical protein
MFKGRESTRQLENLLGTNFYKLFLHVFGIMFIIERIRELSRQDGVTVNNFIRRSYLNNVEEKLVRYKESGEPQIDTSGKSLYFFQHPKTKTILAITEDVCYSDSSHGRIVYAFMTSTGKVLPDPECFGEIITRTEEIRFSVQQIL